MAYTTETKIENYLMIDIDASMSAQISDWIAGVKAFIDKYTGRAFEAAAEIRYFDGNGTMEIIIDSFVGSPTLVEIIESNGQDVEFSLTEGKEADYIVFPYNEDPKYKLIMMAGSQAGAWYTGEKRIKVTANFGNATTVPKDIEFAATVLAGKIIERGMKGGEIQSESLGDYSVSFAQEDADQEVLNVKKILDKYKIFEL